MPTPDARRRASRVAIDTFAPSAARSPGFEDAVFAAMAAPGFRRLAPPAAPARVVERARRSLGLPPVVLGVPMVESRFATDLTSPGCAAGPWQLVPETARSLGLRVSGCTVDGLDEAWSPAAGVPTRFSPYRSDDGCRITRCAVDERRDLRRSTDAALRYLASSTDGDLQAHPQRDLLRLVAYNAGPARMRWWVDEHPDDPIGALTACADGGCEVAEEHARFPARVVAGAALVACGALADGLWGSAPVCAAMSEAGLVAPIAPLPLVTPPPGTAAGQLASLLEGADPAGTIVERGAVAWVRLEAGDRVSAAPIVGTVVSAFDTASRDLALGTRDGADALAVALLADAAPGLRACGGASSEDHVLDVTIQDGAATIDGAGCLADALGRLSLPTEVDGARVVMAVHLPAP